MRTGTKPFNKALMVCDTDCRAAFAHYIKLNKEWAVYDNPDQYGVDMLGDNGYGFELEQRLNWTGDVYPYEIVNVPLRKGKWLGRENQNFYLIFNKDCSSCIYLTPAQLRAHIRADNLTMMNCKTDCGLRTEWFYRVPLEEFKQKTLRETL